MKEFEESQLTLEQVLELIKKKADNEKSEAGSFICIEKVYDQHEGWKVVGRIIEE